MFLPTSSQITFVFGGPKININPKLTPQEQWEDFGHELCHALRQYGSQLSMPDDYIFYQEEKADNFALHFCVPTFMLERIDLPQYRTKAIEVIAETFHVTFEFAKKRLEKHEQQLLGTQYSLHIKSQFEAVKQFKKNIGCDYILKDKKKTYFMNNNKGLVGTIENWRAE
ncbi:ImmA/IrrE family metallo-endopeptidase [Anaerobacillus sp. CMMVII]|uniref:ImmA/IrrE family metallo-endopeptidase n=1 Tax=Anaerobacillus sp. CMMVII TaxID=2755588 RepID=UPI0021C4FB7F|nr:ImmA/IrrE family metallo-endopeptidase [Anaerobacillus sp. CMMVII]MCT8138594.1 ImmA/IrrE family metallo-endopeptidase [Anaerobacillus sp. CMMVII]